MNQNNSAQPGLTDDLKDAVDILRALRGYLKSHRINGPTMLCTDGKALNNADDEVLRALKLLVPLSKLRAPGADEQAAELMEEARSEGHSSVAAYVDQLKTSAATYRQERNSARDAVARYREESTTRAPVADEPLGWKICFTDRNGQYKTVLHDHNSVGDYRSIDPMASSIPLGPYSAALASAPVAGEAVAHAVLAYGRIQRVVVNEESAHEYAEQQRLNAEAAGWDAKAHVRPLVYGDAAPQASEAVRDALWTLTEHNALHFGEQHSTVIQGRAALSAQSAQKQGGSDA